MQMEANKKQIKMLYFVAIESVLVIFGYNHKCKLYIYTYGGVVLITYL